ncbi:MAG: hypothetical protein M1381_10875 [Deltaproteobacteria bacterium]|nr:hypothetical protein [Deltaproteobacteria bacterium]
MSISVVNIMHNSFNRLFFKKRVLLLLLFLNILSISCTVTPIIPQITFSENIPLDERLPYRIALIITNKFKDAVYNDTLVTESVCNTNEVGGNIKWNIPFGSKVGTANAELFAQDLSNLFDSVDMYGDIAQIKNKNDYDYILIPYSSVTAHYSQDENLTGSITIDASVEYELQVIDPENSEVIEDFTSQDSSEPSSVPAYCIGLLDYINTINNGYSKVIGEAMSKAFEKLLKQVSGMNENINIITKRLLNIIATKHYERIAILPPVSTTSDVTALIAKLKAKLAKIRISVVNDNLIKSSLSDLDKSKIQNDRIQFAKIIGNLTGADVILIGDRDSLILVDTKSGREYSITNKIKTNGVKY